MRLRAGAYQVERLAYSVPEFAMAAALGRGMVYELVRRGELPAIRIGKRIIIPKEAADDWLRRKAQGQ